MPDGEVEVEVEAGQEPAAGDEEDSARQDAGTVVGAMQSSDTVVSESVATVAGVKVTPAVRALARKLKVDLAIVRPSGKDGVVTRADVESAARSPAPPRPAEAGSATPPRAAATAPPPARTAPSGEWEPIRGTRRTMARIMSESHAKVVPTSIMDDADIHRWNYGQDITVRLLRSLWAGARSNPG